jgi:hypothetical protein
MAAFWACQTADGTITDVYGIGFETMFQVTYYHNARWNARHLSAYGPKDDDELMKYYSLKPLENLYLAIRPMHEGNLQCYQMGIVDKGSFIAIVATKLRDVVLGLKRTAWENFLRHIGWTVTGEKELDPRERSAAHEGCESSSAPRRVGASVDVPPRSCAGPDQGAVSRHPRPVAGRDYHPGAGGRGARRSAEQGH